MLRVRPIDNTLNLAKWYQLRNRIDFEPTYQRKGGIWSIKMKQLFINTILNKYDFPKIYLADFSAGTSDLNEKKKQYAVIDGKQRLSTIFSFFNNDFALDNTPIYLDNGEVVFAENLKYDGLQAKYPSLIKVLESYIPTMMGVESDRIEDVYEMFIRLNINVSISGPERRNALPGPIPSLIRKIALHPFLAENVKFVSASKQSKDRGQDLNAAAKLLMLEINGGKPASTKKADLDNMVIRAAKGDENDFSLYVDKVLASLNLMNLVFPENDELLANQTQLPVYYLFIKNNFDPMLIDSGSRLYKFLLSFEKERKNVKRVLRSRGAGQQEFFDKPLDESYISYNTYIRSPDDRVSIENMLNILENYYEKSLE